MIAAWWKRLVWCCESGGWGGFCGRFAGGGIGLIIYFMIGLMRGGVVVPC